jgi:actin-like ATPase involved in cell morphogenesis
VVYLGEDGGVVVGEAAERRAIDRPDRVVREFKRRIGDETPIIVGDLSVAVQDLFAVLARWVVERAEEQEGESPSVITVSHPASWGEHRLGLVRTALAGVGLGGVEFVSEPEAAGLHYLEREKLEAGQAIAVYDLGGGTFDVAILRKQEDDGFQVIGVPTGLEHLGGADFDQRIFDHVRARAGAAFDDVDERRPDEALALARVRRDCIDAKEALSFDAETVVPVLLPGAQARVRLVRSEFEQMIDGDLRRTVATLHRAVEEAGVELDDLTAVLLIGGSSRIPAIAQLISAELGLPIAVDADPKASISLGAAAAGARTLEVVPVVVDGADGETAAIGGFGAPALVRAPVGASTAVLPPHRMSLGLRATVLAGVAAALLAVLIPITPLAIGTQEQPDDGTEGTSGEPNGAPAGRYSTGAAPIVGGPIQPVLQVGEGAEPGTIADESQPAPARPLSPANGGGAAAPAPAPAPSGSSTAAEGQTPADAATPVTDPVVDPGPAPDPSPQPVPDPSPQPVPDPVPDPTPDPEPSPEPSPDPIPSPSPEPIPDPAPETTEPAPSVP